MAARNRASASPAAPFARHWAPADISSWVSGPSREPANCCGWAVEAMGSGTSDLFLPRGVKGVFGDQHLRRRLVAGEAHPAGDTYAAFQVVNGFWLGESDLGDNDLAEHGVRLAHHGDVEDVVEPEDHILDLGRIDLLAADIDDVADAAEDLDPVAVLLDLVLGVEP